jgi:hypothetical protein
VQQILVEDRVRRTRKIVFYHNDFIELLECSIEFIWNVAIYEFDKRGEFDKDVEVPK